MMDTTEKDRTGKSLRYSLLDGAFASSMIGLGESYFIAFAVFLNASNMQLGMLSTLPQAMGALIQPASNRLISLFGSRKRLVSTAAFLQALVFVPIVLAFHAREWAVHQLMLFVCLYWVFGMVLGPAWNSWMGDLTEDRDRGDYFGRRSKIIALSSFCTFLLAGSVLDLFKKSSMGQYGGFVTIFALAFLARMVSFFFLTRKYEPEYRPGGESVFGFRDFLRQERFSRFRVFALYFGLMNFSVYLAAPFFVPYMLKDLGFSYLTFTSVQAAAVGMKFITMPVWGRISDQFGARKVIAMSGFMMPLVPFLWSFSHDMRYLFGVEMYSGLVWAGFEISTFKFALDTTTAQLRARCMAYYMMINGICIFSGALAGSLLVKYNEVFWSKYLFVFIVSGLMRYAVSFAFISRIKEVVSVEEIPYGKLFLKVMSMMPAVGFMYSLVPFKRGRREKHGRRGDLSRE